MRISPVVVNCSAHLALDRALAECGGVVLLDLRGHVVGHAVLNGGQGDRVVGAGDGRTREWRRAATVRQPRPCRAASGRAPNRGRSSRHRRADRARTSIGISFFPRFFFFLLGRVSVLDGCISSCNEMRRDAVGVADRPAPEPRVGELGRVPERWRRRDGSDRRRRGCRSRRWWWRRHRRDRRG